MTVTFAGLASAVATGISMSAAMSAAIRVLAMGGDLSHGPVKQALARGCRTCRHDPARASGTVGGPAVRTARRPPALPVHGGQRRAPFALQRLRHSRPRT